MAAYSVEWVNHMLAAVWPSLNAATCTAVKNALQPHLDTNTPPFLTAIRFQQVDLGPEPPQVLAVRPVSDVAANKVHLDVDVQFSGHPEVVLHADSGLLLIPVTLHELLVCGCLRLQFDPLVPIWPLFSSLSYAFTKKPLIAFNLKTIGSMDVMNLPLLSSFLEDLVFRLIQDKFTLPKVVIAPNWIIRHAEVSILVYACGCHDAEEDDSSMSGRWRKTPR
jgi:Ca2+-dependent lipid-binding protein